jgi:MHS family shikimate/dehydroshikimate transporter-like MFS transporter
MPASHSERTNTRTLTILAFSATTGALVEFYDFFIYGYAAATAFPAIFFPRLPPTQALVFSYLAFGAAFPARLIGAFLFGHFGDRTGRKFSFLLSIAIVGATTCLTGLLPGYSKLGIAAPVLLVVLRIMQGIGIGGEFGGTSSLLAEFGAERRSKAFWMSLANLGSPISWMGQILGWFRAEAACASRSKRLRACESGANPSGRNFKATKRWSLMSSAL